MQQALLLFLPSAVYRNLLHDNGRKENDADNDNELKLATAVNTVFRTVG